MLEEQEEQALVTAAMGHLRMPLLKLPLLRPLLLLPLQPQTLKAVMLMLPKPQPIAAHPAAEMLAILDRVAMPQPIAVAPEIAVLETLAEAMPTATV